MMHQPIAVFTESKAHTPPANVTTLEDKRTIRESVAKLEEAMEQHPDKVDLYSQAVHHFADGVYARELFMPAGTTITSLIHKTDHFCFVLKGKAEVVDEGAGIVTVEAPCMLRTLAGTKRALHILEDSLWVGVYANPDEEREIEDIAQRIISPVHLDNLLGAGED